jgi:hypothetical protein
MLTGQNGCFSDHLSTVDGLAVLKQTAVALKLLFFATKG